MSQARLSAGDLRQKFEAALAEIDLEHIHRYMGVTNWKWHTLPGFGVPDPGEMTATIRRVFDRCLQMMDAGEENPWCATGGFFVRVWRDEVDVIFDIAHFRGDPRCREFQKAAAWPFTFISESAKLCEIISSARCETSTEIPP